MADRLRVLLIAEACNPTWTSVPLVGYNFARALADGDDLDITLVTQIKNAKALTVDPIAQRVRLHIIDNEWLARPMYRAATLLRGGEKLGWTINTAMAWPSYIAFEKHVSREFATDLGSGKFDIIHRITPLSPTLPSPLASRTSVPMLIGPLNGGLPWPKEYPELIAQEREWLAPLRSAYKSLPYYRSTYRHLAGVIAGSRHTATEIPRSFRGQRFYLPENGIDPNRFALANGWTPPKDKFRFITMGRLVPYKGILLTLEAIDQSPLLRKCELSIIGEGPLLPMVQQFVSSHQLQDTVTISGWTSQTALSQRLQSSQAFVFPSLREFGGGVVLEAMACGLPSIVVDYGGPGELATANCSILLPMQPRDSLIGALRMAMERLASNHDVCQSMSAAAVQRVRDEFVWEKKAERIVGFYRHIVG